MTLPHIQSLATPAGPLAYRRAGSGPPLLMIHGWGGSSRHWLGAFALLAERHDVIALDLPGFGASPPARGPTDLTTLTDAALALCDGLGLRRVAIGGHSLGAAVALLAAVARPQLTARLVLASFGLPRSQSEAALMAAAHAQLSLAAALWAPWLELWRPWLAAALPLRVAAWTTPPLPELLTAPVLSSAGGAAGPALAIGAADLAAMDARAGLEALATGGDQRVTSAAARVAAPALVIGGREDPIFPPSAAQSLAQALPQSGLVLMERCGHVPMAEQPAAFYGALGSFLAA